MRLVERMDGPLRVGKADDEAYWVNETVFWRPSKADRSRIERTGRVQDTEDGLSDHNPAVFVRLHGGATKRSAARFRPDRSAAIRV
jgi:hypothetical protein